MINNDDFLLYWCLNCSQDQGANNVKDLKNFKKTHTTAHSIILIIDIMLRIMYREIKTYGCFEK